MKTMHSQDELGEYQCKFMRISVHLIRANKLSEMDRDALFKHGFHSSHLCLSTSKGIIIVGSKVANDGGTMYLHQVVSDSLQSK